MHVLDGPRSSIFGHQNTGNSNVFLRAETCGGTECLESTALEQLGLTWSERAGYSMSVAEHMED